MLVPPFDEINKILHDNKHFRDKKHYICTQNGTQMKIITSREFRENQKNYFNLAEKEKVIVHRGNKRKPFLLVPINESLESDLYFSDIEIIKLIETGIEEVKKGKITTITDVNNIWTDIL